MAADARGFTAADAAVAKPRSGEKARCAARVGEARNRMAQNRTPLPLLDFAVSALKRARQMGECSEPLRRKRNAR